MSLALIVGGIALTVIILALQQRYQGGLSKVPGPFIGSITDLYRFLNVWSDDAADGSVRLHKKYGPLVRMGPRYVSASSTEAIHKIYRQGTGFQKAGTYSLLQPSYEGSDLHNLFSTQDKALHATVKRNIGSLFSQRGIAPYEESIERTISVLRRQWEAKMVNGRARIDVSAWLQYWAFDTIGEINFSKDLGFLSRGEDVQSLCAENHHNMMYFGLMGQVPYIEKHYRKIMSMMSSRKHNPLFQFVLDRLSEREKSPRTGKDLLDAFLIVHEERPDGFARRDVIAAAYISLVTAHDVLAITLRAVLYHLAKNPEVRQKVRTEIAAAEKANKLSSVAKQSEIEDLTYVNAVALEALRIHPSTGLMFERYVPAGGVELHGTYIPAGTTIGVNAWVFNRDELFGTDAETFRPERWLDSELEQLKEMKKWMFTFSAGSRACIGRHLAMMEMNKLIVELYRNYDIQLPDPNHEWHVDGNWLTAQTDMDMLVTKSPVT